MSTARRANDVQGRLQRLAAKGNLAVAPSPEAVISTRPSGTFARP